MVFGQKSYVETAREENQSLYISSSVIITIAGFVFTACFFTVMYQSIDLSFSFIIMALMKSLVMVSLMMIGSTIVAKIFHSAIMRGMNAFLLGLVFGIFLVFFSL